MTGAELKARREALGLTIEQLSEKLDVTPARIVEDWENNLDVQACVKYSARMLELAMDQLEYLATSMSDEEFKALQNRVDGALASAKQAIGGA
ncbi:MAG: helix-turn-helix domain-containing protein [Acidobacteria bacterium]|nr:helix-turn-helix domain-containing protein [Acidobacteriota bacterium]